ncbi:hypothetical protein AAFF_G00066820 [Aldrovandia affinis]|uniref:Uncharacterized protein n=1 Tax=Aldrovandia affinis TaxID=143900 RepID=A0AAD7T435_9TELE|nr:hypothetical protein AAFF_G00066820 [Aldrovandia affinis]
MLAMWKVPSCGLSQGKHLQVLHEINARTTKKAHKEESCLESTATEVLYLDRLTDCCVLLKVVRVLLHGDSTLDTYAILDDGSERTMLLPAATWKLGLQGTPEDLALRNIRQGIQTRPPWRISVIPHLPRITAKEEFSH